MLKKRALWSLLVLMMLLLPIEPVAANTGGHKSPAKESSRIFPRKKTMSVGKRITVRVKSAGNVCWKTSRGDIVAIEKKSGGKAILFARKKGKATVTAVYKGKQCSCKITVRDKEKAKSLPKKEAPVLNADFINLYYRPDAYSDILPTMPKHKVSFSLKLTDSKAKVRKWEILGEDSFFFTITEYGLVTLRHGPCYSEPCVEAVARATLTDGSTLTAKVRGYNELNSYLDSLFQKFADENITPGMTDKEKADRVAEYIGEISDYEFYDSDWTDIFLKGRGDCMASRYAVETLCRYIGVKAQGCGSGNEHGKTVVKADGKYYIYTTGFNEPRPRSYMVSETSYGYLAGHAKEMGLWMGYFDR